jgi:hypothetical protein
MNEEPITKMATFTMTREVPGTYKVEVNAVSINPRVIKEVREIPSLILNFYSI